MPQNLPQKKNVKKTNVAQKYFSPQKKVNFLGDNSAKKVFF
jgi:hypothetical protein